MVTAIFAQTEIRGYDYPEEHPSVIAHVSKRRNAQFLKNGIHPQGNISGVTVVTYVSRTPKHPGPASLVPGGHFVRQPTDTWGHKTCGTQIPPRGTSSGGRPDTRYCQARKRRTPAKKEEHFTMGHLETPESLAAGQKTPHHGTLESPAIRI